MLGLTVDPGEYRGRFVADAHLLNTRGTLWGGCGLAAAIAFVQACGGRDCVWAHTQFLAPVHAGQEVELSVDPATGGLSQVVVRATAAGRLVFLAGGTFSRVSGAVNRFGPAGDWAPDPDGCPPREYPTWLDFPRDGVISLVEQRWARPARTDLDGRPGGGSSALWLRLRPRLPVHAAVLALLGDFAPVGLIEATGEMAAGTSLDNSLRIVAAPTGEWVLLDVRVEAIVRNVAQVRGADVRPHGCAGCHREPDDAGPPGAPPGPGEPARSAVTRPDRLTRSPVELAVGSSRARRAPALPEHAKT